MVLWFEEAQQGKEVSVEGGRVKEGVSKNEAIISYIHPGLLDISIHFFCFGM